MILPKKFLTSLLAAVLLCGCGKSPGSAAGEVCECLSKLKGSTGVSEFAGNAAECNQLRQKYADTFEGEDLNVYTRQITECATAGLLE
ncbi:MAG TPA: hypothetical protein VF646_10470 [Cytophagales bacterium]|jgi:hypothetical protein